MASFPQDPEPDSHPKEEETGVEAQEVRVDSPLDDDWMTQSQYGKVVKILCPAI